MRKLMILVFLLPLNCLAQQPNPLNNPNLPGYQNPTQQRLQSQMKTQQQQQQNTLNQQIQNQNLQQQQQLNREIGTNTQRVIQSQPGMIKEPASNHDTETFNSKP
ncbi:DUF2756 domain-containing protein [Citrobacter sp. JGM124]|uniref:DUF2756 domain-containing protein n=1 Tax=Citrobacter sp. JGM124 TaxID=2799789 RepID=UPI001BA80258|nr:DUF2756 domain-containing protein [Citrobacter sp. JGM124]MBS0848232.1 DUF2756 domain-containing protein [Citrobacter sp. JGM124]